MVERYNQPNLPSLVVGTPGVDPSAGVAAGTVAKLAEQSTTEAMQNAGRLFEQQGQFNQQAFNLSGQARQDFSQSMQQSMYAIGEAQRNARVQQEVKAQQRNLQNGLLASNAKLDQQSTVDNAVAQLKQQSSNDPYGAEQSYMNNVVPQLKQQLLAPYQDPTTQKAMLPQINAMLEGGRGEINQWAPKAVTEQVDGQLASIPQKVVGAVSNIDPTQPVADQINQYQKIMTDGLDPYQTLKNQTVSMMPDAAGALRDQKSAQIDAAAGNLKQLAGKNFINNGISSIPDNAAGLQQYNQWRVVLEHSDRYGLNLTGDDKASLLSQLDKQKKQSLDAITGNIQSDTQAGLANAKILQANLVENYSNPAVRNQLTNQLRDNLTSLQAQLKQVQAQPVAQGSPEETIKKAQLSSIDQQLGQILGGEKQGLQEQNSNEQLKRTMTSFAHSMTTYQEGQTRYQQSQIQYGQGQLRFLQGQQDRDQKIQTQQNTAAHLQSVQAYNQAMQPIMNQQSAVLGMPLGPERLKAAQDHATQIYDVADNAFKTGAINANQYRSVMNQATDLLNKSQYKTNSGFFGIGGGNAITPNTPKDKAAAALNANSQMAQISHTSQQNIQSVQTLMSVGQNMTTDPHEQALLNKYLVTHGQVGMDMLNKAAKGNQQQVQQKLPSYLGNILDQIRQGNIK